jgi:hypothetical protein
MADYLQLARDAVAALADAAFLFPVLTYGVALMSAAALLLTLAHLLTMGGKSATRWAAVAVWLLVALAAGGAQLIGGDDLKAALDWPLDTAQLEVIAQHRTILMWAWAAPLPAVLLVLLAMVPKSGGTRVGLLALALVLAGLASVYGVTLVYSHEKTFRMPIALTVDMQVELPEAVRERLRSRSPSNDEDAAPDDDATGDNEAPVQFFGIPID